MASNSVWSAASSVSNGSCSWPQECMLSSNTDSSFKPASKWRILRSVFNCTRIWRDVFRQAQNLRVCYTVDVRFRSIEMNQDLATKKSTFVKAPSLPTNMPLTQFRESLDTKQLEKSRHGCKRSCISQDLLYFGQVYKPFSLVCSPQQPILEAVVVVAVVFLSLGDRYPTDHVDWGVWGTFYLLQGTSLESKNSCVSIVTLFQAASILLFQAAYFWLKFREALGLRFDRKRKHSELFQHEGVVHQSLRGMHDCKSQGLQVGDEADRDPGVYLREATGKWEPRFKPPRAKLDSGIQLDRLALGAYNTRDEAGIVRRFAAFYYGKNEGKVEFEDGSHFLIPPMNPEEQKLYGKEKKEWVTQKAKELFQLLPKDAKLKRPRRATLTIEQFGSRNDGGAFFQSPIAQDTPPSDLLPKTQNDTPSTNDYGEIAGSDEDFSDMVSEYFPGGTKTLGDPTVPPECNHIIQRFESCQPELEPTLHPGSEFVKSSIFFRQTSRDPQLVLQVNRQKEQLEFAAVQNVKLQYQLTQAQDYILKLQQVTATSQVHILKLQQEVEQLGSELQRVAAISQVHILKLQQEVEQLGSELQRVASTSQVSVLWNSI